MGLLRNFLTAGAVIGAIAVTSAANASPLIRFDVGQPDGATVTNEVIYDGGAAGTIHSSATNTISATQVSGFNPFISPVAITGGLFTFDGGPQTNFFIDGDGNTNWSFDNGGTWEITGSLDGNPANSGRVIARGNIDRIVTSTVSGNVIPEVRRYEFTLVDVEISQELFDALDLATNDADGFWADSVFAESAPGVPLNPVPNTNDVGSFLIDLFLDGVPTSALAPYNASFQDSERLQLAAVPEPMTIGLLGLGLIGLGAARRRKQAA